MRLSPDSGEEWAKANFAGALRQFDHCCGVLERDLGASPSSQITDLLPDRMHV